MSETDELSARVLQLECQLQVQALVMIQMVCKLAAKEPKRGGYIDQIEQSTSAAIDQLEIPESIEPKVRAMLHDANKVLHSTFRSTFAMPVNLPKTGTANDR